MVESPPPSLDATAHTARPGLIKITREHYERIMEYAKLGLQIVIRNQVFTVVDLHPAFLTREQIDPANREELELYFEHGLLYYYYLDLRSEGTLSLDRSRMSLVPCASDQYPEILEGRIKIGVDNHQKPL